MGEQQRSFIEQARRAQIIDAAVETIAAKGFAGASLAQIAERARISKGVISYHFFGKDELIEQVVGQIFERIEAFMAPRLEEQEAGGGWLRTYIQSLAEYMHGHRSQLAALSAIFHNFRAADGSPRYGVVSTEPLYAALEEVFRQAQQRGEFRAFDPRVMAVSLQSGLDAMFEYWSAYPEHDLAAHARELADLYEHATRAQHPPTE